MPITSHPCFTTPAIGQRLWRFMDFPRFFYLMTKCQIFFPSLALLGNDPWEGLLPRPNLDPNRMVSVEFRSGTDGSLQDVRTMSQADVRGGHLRFASYVAGRVQVMEKWKKKIYVSCWHMNDAESEALWRIYGGQGFGVSVKTTYERLGSALGSTYRIVGGMVKYLDEATELVDERTSLDCCFWKRRSFAHEAEFRAVISLANADPDAGAPGLVVPVNLGQLIEEIIVAPTAEDWFVSLVVDFVGSCGYSGKVGRSTLLDRPSY